MKKEIILVTLLLSGCGTNNSTSIDCKNSSLSTSSSITTIEKYVSDYAYVSDIDAGYHFEYFTNDGNLAMFSSIGVGNPEVGHVTYVSLKDYGVTNLIFGDSISISSSYRAWSDAMIGGTVYYEELYDIQYYPSILYEVEFTKEVVEGDQVHISINSTLNNLLENLVNTFVISEDENGNCIHKPLSDYDDNTTLYYSFNQKMNNPHKYSFLYDYKVR